MSNHSNLYDILDLPATASVDEIKSAFRKSALQHHPDRNKNTTESAARFRVIYNAYSILSAPARRREYDTYLRTSTVFGDPNGLAAHPTSNRNRPHIAGTSDTLATLLSHLSYVLWDIEDLIRTKPNWNRTFDGLSVRGYVLKMLTFIDRWILDTMGFPDYFFQARRMSAPAKADILHESKKPGHRPFVNIHDYFYNIRLRTDKFLKSAGLIELFEPVPGTGVRIIDCVLEAHNLSVHYLGCLKSALAGEIESIPPFRHTNPCFDV